MPPYGRLLEFKKSKLRFLKMYVLCAGCLGQSPAILTQFTLKMCVAGGNSQKITKNPFLKVQGHSRSSTLTPIKSLSLLFVMISSMFVPICNCFHATRDNCGKITTF